MDGNILANKSAYDRPKTDFYPTPDEVTIALLNYLEIPDGSTIWECACGEGHMAKALAKRGHWVYPTDLNETGYGYNGIDYLKTQMIPCDWIITNPPFNVSEEFIRRSIEHKKPFALLLKSQYWHSKSRLKVFEDFRPEAVLPLTWRPDFLFGAKGGAPTMECIWTVWGTESAKITRYEPLKKPNIKEAV
ncbi:MAG TPA: SAM-dependent DNA methyltransferase [Ruminiclostridium sp.]